MSNDLKNKLEFIDFDISPIGRRLRMVLIKDRASVDYLLKEFNGQPLELSKSNPKNTWQYEGDLFQLSNKLILVDQSEDHKANPYYLCSTLDDYFFIADNFFVFRTGPYDPAIVEYRIHLDHIRIKEFLSKASVHFIKYDESTNQEIYKTDDNKFIVVKSVPNNGTTNENPFKIISDLFVKPEYSIDSRIYIELTMFESFTMMQKSGILANDQEDVE